MAAPFARSATFADQLGTVACETARTAPKGAGAGRRRKPNNAAAGGGVQRATGGGGRMTLRSALLALILRSMYITVSLIATAAAKHYCQSVGTSYM